MGLGVKNLSRRQPRESSEGTDGGDYATHRLHEERSETRFLWFYRTGKFPYGTIPFKNKFAKLGVVDIQGSSSHIGQDRAYKIQCPAQDVQYMLQRRTNGGPSSRMKSRNGNAETMKGSSRRSLCHYGTLCFPKKAEHKASEPIIMASRICNKRRLPSF